ncbi:MAG: alpha/beta hydrolase [Prevotella sp.]|jgi:acetyl esterase/lipase|nr:alpha/beta hydrolase [Prevotella sp.]
MIKRLILLTGMVIMAVIVFSQNYELKENIPYTAEGEMDRYKKERCKLDIYYPAGKTDYSTIVWFHGGGLEGGEKGIPSELKDKGVAVVAVNYRLSPKAKNPAYTEDAAEAVAWVFNNIASFKGSPDKIFVSGHSAGGYLSLMIGLDKSYLTKHNIDADKIKGLIPVSGQTNTHYTIKKERGLSFDIPYIDEYAPITHARKDAPPILLITGDRSMELAARYEENAHLDVILRTVGHKDVTLYELQGFDHGGVYAPACYLMLDWITKHTK